MPISLVPARPVHHLFMGRGTCKDKQSKGRLSASLRGAPAVGHPAGLSALTGCAELDKLIERYSIGESKTTDATKLAPVASFRDPQSALFQCVASAYHFLAFLQAAGVDARVIGWDEGKRRPRTGAGYADPPTGAFSRADAHCLTLITHAGKTYTVDWTASQFGYTAFPLVQCFDAKTKRFQRPTSL